MKHDDEQFFRWHKSASPEELQLVDTVFDYEDLFDDMLFKPGTATYDLIRCKSKLQGSDEWIDADISIPEELSLFSPEYLHYKVEKCNNLLGFYDHEKQLICVSPDQIQNASTILHEMTHVHEFLINDLPLYFHDMVFWALYKDLKFRIPKLDQVISEHAHILNESNLYLSGGLHDILFLLKTFDLDIRMDYPLGTVFGYGRSDVFKAYEYNKGRKIIPITVETDETSL